MNTGFLRRGLTLLELIVALAITALLLGGVFGVAAGTASARRAMEERQHRRDGLRTAADLMAADLRMAVIPAARRGLPLRVRGWDEMADGLKTGEVLRVLTGNGVDWSGGGTPAGGAVWVRWFLEPGGEPSGFLLVREQRLMAPAAEAGGPADAEELGSLLDRLVVCQTVQAIDLVAVRPEPTELARVPAGTGPGAGSPSRMSRGPSYPAGAELTIRLTGRTAAGADVGADNASEIRRVLALPVLAGRELGEFHDSGRSVR